MYVFKNKDSIIFKISVLVIFLLCGFVFAKLYQPQAKTVNIYKQALRDYENGNYSNSYYLFSKISYLSKLKPVAIYRQALCARALGDEKSELRRYQQLFNNYPSDKLSIESKYLAGQLVLDNNPNLALKYFKSVSKLTTDEDYKIASEFYKAKITASKIRYSNKIFSRAKIANVEKSFREYLTKYPDGRLAVNAANTWKKFNPNIKSQDAVLLARAYYFAQMYDEALTVFKKTQLKESWALQSATAYSKHDYNKTKTLTEQGVSKYSDNVRRDDYKMAVDSYLSLFEDKDKFKYSSKLFSLAKGKNKDYIWNLKCSYSPQGSKYACYKDLYMNYPNGEYAENSLLQILFFEINNKNFAGARNLAKDFMTKYPESENYPKVLFWAGKIEQKYYNTALAVTYYQDIVNKYPDSYYAYRAYWLLKGVHQSTIAAALDYKPVIYPYRYPNPQEILYNLLEVKDYDMILKYTKDDFIKSWIEYEQGNYASSTIIARDAMAKLPVKPVKSDLRWRLVYPQNYYKQVKNFASQYKNNDALMMAIIREESYFNPEAQSGAGAIGLMQLMPATAHEIGAKNGINFNTSYLFNPELNIKLGNLYYSTIRGMLGNKDVSAIAAYNGGIGSVTRWKSTLNYNDTDEFIEQIPYDETKNYVIKVFRSYWNYTRIYQR